MGNVVLFKLTGDDTVWLADLEAGTVEPAPPEAIEMEGGAVRTVGVELAAVAQDRSTGASQQVFPSR